MNDLSHLGQDGCVQGAVFGNPVESCQLEVNGVKGVPSSERGLDMPAAGRDAVLGSSEIDRTPVERAPVGKGWKRLRDRENDLARPGGFAKPARSRIQRLVESGHAFSGREVESQDGGWVLAPQLSTKVDC